ncbi:MAG: hypothetical protein WCK82_12800, partial [Bacteroidota bacterium]
GFCASVSDLIKFLAFTTWRKANNFETITFFASLGLRSSPLNTPAAALWSFDHSRQAKEKNFVNSLWIPLRR